MTSSWPPVAHRDRGWRGRPSLSSAVLLTLLVATLVMPVSYRAGTDHAHAHTLFQGLFDAIAGEPHHHAGPAREPAAIPLSAQAGLGAVAAPVTPVSAEPDPPEQLGLLAPISSAAAIQVLGLLIAALVSSVTNRTLWETTHRPLAHAIGVELPPPRPPSSMRSTIAGPDPD